ncbi:MAG: hypothetical protein JO064_09885 [Actinobacteria bacterium]|nr:hypothetical protein [Actinomycetota bacterium]
MLEKVFPTALRGAGATGTFVLAFLLAALVTAGVAGATTVTISGSMEGGLQIAPGTTVYGGYDFSVAGNNAADTVALTNGSVSITGPCKGGSDNGQQETLTISLADDQETVSDSQWYPTGDHSAGAGYQGSTTSSLCPGGTLDASHGATFSLDVAASNTARSVNVRFHYRTTGAGNWSGQKTVSPSALPQTTTSTTTPTTTTQSSTTTTTTQSTTTTTTTTTQTTTTTPQQTTTTTPQQTTTTTQQTTTTPQQTTTTQAAPSCAPGSTMTSSGTCVYPTECSSGATYQNGACVYPTQCPSGTTLQNGACVFPLQCPSGTTLQNGQCVQQMLTATCPSGTTLQNGQCVQPQSCPSGSTQQNGQCVTPQACPAGTITLQDGQCVTPPKTSAPAPLLPAPAAKAPATAPVAVRQPAPSASDRGLTISLTERDQSGGGRYTAGPLAAGLGDVLAYRIVLGNTSNGAMLAQVTDTGCQVSPGGKTLSQSGILIRPSESVSFDCWHKLALPVTYTNTATAVVGSSAGIVAGPVSGRVVANVQVLGAKKTLHTKAKKARKTAPMHR